MRERPRSLIRAAKRVRNLIKDPLPRNKELVFERYELEYPRIRCIFSVGGKEYSSGLRLGSVTLEQFQAIGSEALHAVAITTGLMFIPIFFKLSDFASVRVACARLDEQTLQFLEDHTQENLKEFRYLVGLDPKRRVRYSSTGDRPLVAIEFSSPRDRVLLLNGGGKDSIVCAELFKRAGIDFAWFSLQDFEARRNVAEASGVSEYHWIQREAAKRSMAGVSYEFGVNVVSGILCTAALLPAIVHGFKYIAMGNEYSAEDANVVHDGVPINHQYEKTIGFEQTFNEFIERNVLRGVQFFSPVRPYYELRLAQLFSHCDEYFNVFQSCNRQIWNNTWCCECEKCAFIFLALYPFVDREKLLGIFGKNLFDRQITRHHMWSMAAAKIKPWECIGVREECQLALALALRKTPTMDWSDWPRRTDLEAAVAGLDVEEAQRRILESYHEPNRIPEHFVGPLRRAAQEFRS